MASGGLSIALAFLATDDNFLRNYLVMYGSASVLTGITELAIRPNASGPSIAFTHMPMGTPDEVQARVARFARTVTQVVARQRRDWSHADLRHGDGYALTMKGTLAPAAAGAALH